VSTSKQLAESLLQPSPGEAGAGPEIIRLSDVVSQRLEWLWEDRFPVGKLSFLVGDPDLGKSFVTLDIAARVSTGTPFPDTQHLPNPTGSVVLLSAEDDPEDTIRPRLEALGADLSRIILLKSIRHIGDNGKLRSLPVSLDEDIPAVEEAIERAGDCRAVIIDPISAYLGQRLDSHKNSEVRSVLAPLAELAARCRVAIILVSHLSKAAGPAMYRTSGSLGFVAAARAVWAVGRDRNDPERRLMVRVKCNLARATHGLAYRMVDSPDVPGMVLVAWDKDPVMLSADDLLAPPERKRSRRDEAGDWLLDALRDGPLPQKELRQLADDNGISWASVRRAKSEIGVKVNRSGFGPGAVWYWSLPAPGEQTDADRDGSDAA
jgi:KaiC/GvpD/RAD55 family RecA-like ATPase